MIKNFTLGAIFAFCAQGFFETIGFTAILILPWWLYATGAVLTVILAAILVLVDETNH